MWTPEIASIYRDLYQDWRCVVRRFVLPRTVRMERIGHSTGRRRRDGDPCRDCSHGDTCLEGFGDYVRVEPELNGYYCYLRRDLRFSWREIVDAGPRASAILKSALHAATKGFSDALLRNAVLRYIVVPFCNYNCFVPGTSISWCHKTSGNFMFPGRPQRTYSNHHFIVLNQKGSECHE